MITGTLSLSSDQVNTTFVNHARLFASGTDLIYRPVTSKTFDGGYFIHPGLTYTDTDFFYQNGEEDILVLLSGSVYNTCELLPDQEKPGHLSVPGLIALLYLREGPQFVARLNGDFAIFIQRPLKNEACLFRDQVGIRPLAWARVGNTVHFSSDINTLCQMVSEGKPADEDYLLGYFKYTDKRVTPNPGVHKLLPGHCICFSESGTRNIQYWHPEKKRINSFLSTDKMFSELNSILVDAIKIRCDSRFQAGAHVTGGIDSGIVAAHAREYYKSQKLFYGFSWSPKDYDPGEVKYDERALVLSTCKKAGIEPLFTRLQADDLAGGDAGHNGSPWLFYENDTVDQAVQHGVNLIFSGWGGDEFISTGDRGIEQDLLRNMRFNVFLTRNPIRPLKAFVRNQLHFVIYPALGILDRATASSFSDDARYLKKRYKKSDRRALSDFYFHRSRRQMHLKMLSFYHLQQRCEEWMIRGYRRGVEYRYPLLDRRIVEYMLTVPTELLVKSGDYRPLLRELGKYLLPEDVRLNYGKNDPVSHSYTMKLYRDSALMLMDEAEKWRSNPDLFFIDFDLLSRDIKLFREIGDIQDDQVLFKGLVYIKSVHEFTRRYRENCGST